MEKVFISGTEVLLNKKSVLDFISDQLGKNENSSVINGNIFFVQDMLLCDEKELMLNVVQALEKATGYKLSPVLWKMI